MTQEELNLVIPLISNEPVLRGDAIILLEGDGYERIPYACHLLHSHAAKVLVFSGGIHNKEYGSYPFEMCKELIYSLGVLPEQILLETGSMNTREQAVNIIDLAVDNQWSSIILVATHYHQYRAFLTFLKVAEERNLQNKLMIINAPAKEAKWFVKAKWGERFSLLKDELQKILHYAKLGHISSFQTVIEYYKWKESQ